MINWEKRVSSDDKSVDLQGLPYYNLTFGEKSEKQIIYDTECWIPEPPSDESCINYGLSEYNQIFRFTHIPEQVRFRDKDFGRENWTEKEVDAFVDAEWNRRKNGAWYWIKGIKTYIPGTLYLKMNYWTSITSEEFIYRDSDREFFVFTLNSTHHPKCKGIADFKCRQLGDTENALVYSYERGSRIRGSLHTMQSFVNEDHVIETYQRLVHGHSNMIYYFKPMNRGTENPAKGIYCAYPSKHITHAEIERQRKAGQSVSTSSLEAYQHEPLGSRFKYGTSKILRFDGATGICTAYGDEFGKAKDMNPVEWIQTMAEATFSSIRGIKRGMIIMTSTVEEISSDSLEWAQTIYREANPNKLLKSGNTINGLWRIFRGVAERGFDGIVGDRWGFIDKKLVIEAVTEKYDAMIEAGNRRGAMSFLRKNPRTIEDVFLTAQNEGSFNTEGLENRWKYLDSLSVGERPYIMGDFKWKDGIPDTTVIWIPNSKGKFCISKFPSDFGLEDNKRVDGIMANKPGNTHTFCSGLDPIDQTETIATDEERSKLSFAIMAKYNKDIDSGEHLYYQFDDEIRGIKKGMPLNQGSEFKTNRFVCTYMHRSDNPDDDFENVILAHVFYGSDFLPEKNKYGGLKSYIKGRGYAGYEMEKPTDVKNYKGQTEKGGVTATENSISMYFDFITAYTFSMANAIDHPLLCTQWATMNYKNKTKKDLGVAAGWALYASKQKKARWHGDKQKRVIKHFTNNYV